MRAAELRELGRIPSPLLRRGGESGFSRVSWDDAMAVMTERMRGIDPDRMAFYLTSRGIPNETYYAAQKAIRAMGCNHLDNAARICHSPSTTGLKAGLGVAATTCSYSDWIGTDLVVFFGSNVANNQPVATKYLYLARKAGTRIAVVNALREPGMERYWIPSVVDSALFGSKLATDFFGVHIGGDIAFIHGAVKHMIAEGLVDADFIAEHTVGFDELAALLATLPWERLEALSGTSRAEMAAFGALVGGAERAVFVWSMGITQHTHGEDGVRAIINLALTGGFVGRDGCGLMPIRGHSGVQGGAEMGCYASAFPGGLPVDKAHASELSEAWGFPVPHQRGMTAPEVLERAAEGGLDLYWSVGGNALEVLPEPRWVEEALGRIGTRVHQDIVLSPQMFVAPPRDGWVLILPATTRYEIPGGCTQTSTERRIMFSPEIPGPRVAEARPEGAVLLEVARRVRPEHAQAIGRPSTADLRQEIARIVPFYAGIETLAHAGDQVQYGGRHLCAGHVFPTPDGKAHFGAVPLPATAAPDGMFAVTTRRGKQFNSMVHEARDSLTGATRHAVLMAQADVGRLGLAAGDRVVVTNEVGRLEGTVVIAPVTPGNVQVHWPEGNVLIQRGRRSPNAQIPDYNAVATVVRLGA